MRYVTDTGRAISKGRVTKRSNLVRTRQRGQEKPLPMHLQCHPKALSRTPTHPGCATYKPDYGIMLYYVRQAQEGGDTTGFGSGRWLSGSGPFRIVVDGFGEYRHNDLIQAMGWCKAAKRFGFQAEVFVD